MSGVFGSKELERALVQLPKAMSKSVLVRAMKKVAGPILEDAKLRVHVRSGSLKGSLAIGTNLKKTQRSFQFKKGLPQVFIGATWPEGAHAHLEEFGTVKTRPHPFLRPSWDSGKDKALKDLRRETWKALAKQARTLARKAAKGTLSRSSRAALGG